MAIWQFSLHLLPRAALAAHFGEIPPRLDRDLWWSDDRDWWAGCELSPDHPERLDAVLPRMESHWSRRTAAWGAYESNSVEISWNERGVEDVYVRLDLAHANPIFWRAVCELGKASDCHFLTEDMMLILPQIELLLREVEQSSAVRFLSDPEGFLDSLRGMPPRAVD